MIDKTNDGENMNKKRKYIGMTLLIVALLVVGIVYALPQRGTDKGERSIRGGCLDQLTEEQREALNQMVEELREAGASREEIREAIQQFLEEQGIDIEDCFGPMEGFGPRGPGPMGSCFDQLTEEQREALNQMVEELREAGATPQEIREAIQQFLEEQGIDIEDCFGGGMGGPEHGKQGKGGS